MSELWEPKLSTSTEEAAEAQRALVRRENKGTRRVNQFCVPRDRIFVSKLKLPSTYPSSGLQGLKVSWDTRSLPDEFPTDTRRGSGLTGGGGS